MSELTCQASDGADWTIYKDTAGEWRWRCKVGRHIVGAAHEGYKNKVDCIANARRPGLDTEPVERPDGTWACKGSNGDEWLIRKSGDEWRWTRTAHVFGRTEVVGRSTEGYSNRQECVANAQRPGMDCDPV